MDSDVVALVLAGVANVIGAVLAVGMWRRRRRWRRVVRSRHPSAGPPIRVGFADGSRRILVTVPPGAPELSIDIVSFRRREPLGVWEAEQLDEPVVVPPGGQALFGEGVDAEVVDVVVAWTARHEAGAVEGSRLFRLPPQRDEPVPAPRSASGLTGLVTVALFALLVASGVLIGRSILGVGVDGGSPAPPTSSIAKTPVVAPTSFPPTEPTTPVPAAGTTTTSTTTLTTTSTTTSATTSTTTSTTTATDQGAVVDAFGRIESCRFGDQCLVVGFTIAGFEGAPTEYICEFDDGSRFDFGFVGDGADTACATGSPTAAITIEVAGVRSETITRP